MMPPGAVNNSRFIHPVRLHYCRRIKSEYAKLVSVAEGRTRVLMAAAIFATRKVASYDAEESPGPKILNVARPALAG